MNNKMQEMINSFTDKVYDYIEMEFGPAIRNSILVTDKKYQWGNRIGMYYMGGRNIPNTATDVVVIYRKYNPNK